VLALGVISGTALKIGFAMPPLAPETGWWVLVRWFKMCALLSQRNTWRQTVKCRIPAGR
jgi:hypothetical protein